MKKTWTWAVSAVLSVCMMTTSVLSANAVALGGGSDAENSVSTLSLSSSAMLSALKTGADFPIQKLTDADGTDTAVYQLSDGIYYIDETVTGSSKNLTVNGGDNKKKNGIAVAKNATAYIYIPENVTLTVYGGNGTPAGDAKDGTPGTVSMTWFNAYGFYIKAPQSATGGESGAQGKSATGGGAAVYVPESAKLVVLGEGKLEAYGGNGGKASLGAVGMSSYYWSMGYYYAADIDKAHTFTNDKRYNTNWYQRVAVQSADVYASTSYQLAGAGGTGGNGAGGGGAAIGTNGANGGTGAKGAKGSAGTAGITAPVLYLPLIRGTKNLSTQPAESAGTIYIASTVKTTGTAGEGGAAYADKDKKAEKWDNSAVDGSGHTVDPSSDHFKVDVSVHIIPASDGVFQHYANTPEEGHTMAIYVTNARRGGSGGAGGSGSLIGAGGAGGAGGGGGDSGSVVNELNAVYKTYWATDFATGDDGSAGLDGTPSITTLDPANLPYNTITFTGVNDANPEKYYLQKAETITVPDYIPDASTNKVFKGWKITQAANELPTVFGETASQLLSSDTTLYQPGATITATGIYGNVVLTAVLEEAGYNVDTTHCTVSVDTQTNVTTATDVPAGETVSIQADIAAPGSSVKEITAYKAGSPTDKVTLTAKDTTKGTASFTMPDYNVHVEVEYTPDNFVITVNDGTVQGAIEQKDKRMTATCGYELTLTAAEKEGKRFTGWTLTPDDATATVTVTGDPTKDATIRVIMPPCGLTATANYEDIVYTVNIKPDPDDNNNGHCTVTPAAGGIMGATITLQADDRTADGWEFESFTVTADDLNNAEQGVKLNVGARTGTFTMPASNVTVKVNYRRSGYAVTVRNGQLQVDNGSWVNVAKAQAGAEVTLQARTPDTAAGEEFTGWKFTQDTAEGKEVVVNVLENGNPDTDLTLKITMPAKNLVATATYRGANEHAIRIVDEGGQDSGYAQVDGEPVTSAAEGKEVYITAAAKLDKVFERWEVSCEDKTLNLDDYFANFDAESERTHFTMPGCAVTFTAYYKAADPTTPTEPTPSGDMISKGEAAGTAVAAAAGAVGAGLVIWQGSELAMRIYRNKTIQIDYWPGNRIALAQLIWSRAGSPEPESDAPFADITEALDTLNDTNINAQKAARWCVEQGLLDAKTNDDGTECFEPMKHVTHLRVCLTWQNARKMGLFEVPTETEA